MSAFDDFIRALRDDAAWSIDDLVAMGVAEPFELGSVVIPIAWLEPEHRADLIKAIWNAAALQAPEYILEGPDRAVLSVPDITNPGETIIFEMRSYGDKKVIEAEGIVVCHLIA